MKQKSNGSVAELDRELERLVAEVREPGFLERLEAPVQARLIKAAREHNEILRRSRENAWNRVFR